MSQLLNVKTFPPVMVVDILRINTIKQNLFEPVHDLFVWFGSLRPLNNLSVVRDGSSWV